MDISQNCINTIHNSINLYHQNIHGYNDNMRRYLHIVEDMYRDNLASHPPIQNINIASSENIDHPTPFHNNTFIQQYLQNRAEDTLLRGSYEDVVVRPTNDEIEAAISTVIYDESHENHNTSCPITLDPFQSGEELCCIRHCSHLFKRQALMDWFQRNVRCPVCRYDIRDFVTPDDNQFDDLVQEFIDETMDRVRIPAVPVPNVRTRNNTGFTSLFTNTIRSFVNRELNNLPRHLNNAAELIYTFDIPISMDVSGNYQI